MVMGSAFPVDSEGMGGAARYRLWILSRAAGIKKLSLHDGRGLAIAGIGGHGAQPWEGRIEPQGRCALYARGSGR